MQLTNFVRKGAHPETDGAIVARFLSRIAISRNPADCWIWTAACIVRENGQRSYGRFVVHGEVTSAHRFMYKLVNGEVPDGLIVRHTCDNEQCVNPGHLVSGTHKDNVADMFERGRGDHRIGERNFKAKLTEDQVRQIRAMYKGGLSPKAIVESQSISRSQFYRIVKRTHWRHLDD